MLEIKIEGLSEIEKKLKKISEKFARKIVLKALKKGAKPIIKSAQSKVNNRSGVLAKSIGSVVVPQRKSHNTIIDIGPRVIPSSNVKSDVGETDDSITKKTDGFYGGYVEFGTKDSRPHPFLRPAFDANAEKALEIIVEEMLKELNKIL